MKRSGPTGQRLTAAFLLGAIALNYPILSLFGGPTTVAGIPLLYAYVFGTWIALIAVMAFVIERRRE